MAHQSCLKVLIADDHGLYRTGLGLLLKDEIGASEVVEVGSFDEALDRLARNMDVRLALFDLSMPGAGGPESLRVVKETYPNLQVAIVSGSEDRHNVLNSLAMGLNGYIPKSLPESEIADALKIIINGGVYVPRFMIATASQTRASHAADRDNELPRPEARSLDVGSLTPRQRDVLRCIQKGLANKEIARELDIAEGTVKIHLAALFNHFGVRNRTELVLRAQNLPGWKGPD